MRQFKQLLAFAVLMCTAGLTMAASNVVIFNAQAAVLSSEQAKKTLEELRADSDYAGLQAQLESLKTDMQELRKESENKSMTWSSDQVADHRKKMESVGSDLQYTAKKIQAEQQTVLQSIMQEMQPRVEKALMEVVKEEKVDMVLDSQTVFFATPAVDITAKVTEKLNQAK